jgi:hypothetical protein
MAGLRPGNQRSAARGKEQAVRKNNTINEVYTCSRYPGQELERGVTGDP